MTKDFVKFLAVVLILYLGFLTTFAMLARDTFSVRHISWILVYVFFGSSYMGFDTATKISPMLGPPLMMVFVALTNILLLTSLISLLSNSLTKVMDHAREEYLFQYSLFVLEASASRRLTYYLPPLNLIPLILFRPLRPFVHADTLRQLRITTLKVTHWPFVLVIWACESAPPPKYWLAWVSHKSIEDIDNNNNSHANNNNIFNPPHDHQQYLSRTDTESSILSSPNPNPNPNPNTPQTTITNKKSPKNWHLDLQPRQAHGRTTSYGHTLVHASAAIAAANGNTTPTKPRNTMHSIIINNQQSPTTNTTHIHAKPPSADADPNTSSQQGLSASETRDLKTSIANLEILVRQLLADRGGDRDGDRKRRGDGSLGAAEGVGGDDDDEG